MMMNFIHQQHWIYGSRSPNGKGRRVVAPVTRVRVSSITPRESRLVGDISGL